MAQVEVLAGVCGFRTRIIARADEAYTVTLQIESDCAHIRKLAEQLTELAALEELMRPIHQTTVYQLAGNCRTHAACPVPSAILKAVEVAAGMALPADVQITIRPGEEA
jgi:hypothetical protein